MINMGKALLFILCLNIASWMIVQGGLARSGIEPLNVTEKAREMNETLRPLQNPSPGDIFIGYLVMGWNTFFNVLGWLIFGFPMLLASFNVPTLIYAPLIIIWTVIIVLFFIEFVSGRSTTGG